MTSSGWIIMSLSVGGTTAFMVWCIWKVVRKPKNSTKIQSPPEIDLPDD